MVTFIEGNYPSNLGETTKKAKLFLLMDVLEHIEDPRPIVENIVLAASTGAYFVVTVPADQDLWSAHDEAVGVRRHDDSFAARRSCGVAGTGSGRAEPAMQRGRQARG